MSETPQLLAGDGVPQDHAWLIAAAGDHAFAVGRHGGTDFGAMAGAGRQVGAGVEVANADAVAFDDRDTLVAAEGESVRVAVALKAAHFLARVGVPGADKTVTAAGRDMAAVRRKGDEVGP